jgi:hypothetical protein
LSGTCYERNSGVFLRGGHGRGSVTNSRPVDGIGSRG